MKSKGIFWNTLGSMMFALNSMLLVLIVSRFQKVEIAGEFGIAFTTSQILYIVGLFGINIYQMTDYRFKYNFKTYFVAKVLTTILMMLICVGILGLYTNNRNKMIFTFLLTIYMGIYSFAEVYQSLYFQHNRLDLSGKSLFFRTFFSVSAFYVALKLNIPISIAIAVLIGINLVFFYYVTYKPINIIEIKPEKTSLEQVKALLMETIPVFLSLFAMNIMTNVSKYAVDFYKGSEWQGYYNVVFMPVMVINLLSSFIFKPMLNDYATFFLNNEYRRIKKLLFKHLVSIFIFLVVAVLGTYFVGAQILSWIYKIDVTHLRLELIIIVLSGGFVAIASLTYFILIIMRKQKSVFYNYLFCVIIEIGMAVYLVPKYAIFGATLSLLCSQAILVINFLVMIYKNIGENKGCPK